VCTVAILPLAGGGFLLGHNRDESVRRSRGIPPRRYLRDGRAFLAPRDPDGGGTWIGLNEAGAAMCLLNAAEPDPARLPPVPLSRGRILWEILHLDTLDAVVASLRRSRPRLSEVRAFDLVAAAPRRSGARAVRIRWDGRRLREEPGRPPALFVSSGFDPSGAERARGAAWRSFLEAIRGRSDPDALRDALAAWMAGHAPGKGALSVCMHRREARTVSRSLVIAPAGGRGGRGRPGGLRFAYHDGAPCDGGAPETVRRLRLKV
jgi:hypothetical protein